MTVVESNMSFVLKHFECIDLLTIYISKQSPNGLEGQSNKSFPEAAVIGF